MKIMTRDCGEIEVDETSVIHFDSGLIGFEEYRDYILLEIDPDDKESPFRCLQSMDEPTLAFILLNPFAIKPDYEISLDDSIVDRLRLDEQSDAKEPDGNVVIMAITVIPEDINKMSFNLKAPLVINADIRMGEQYIVDNPKYKVRHYINEEAVQGEAATC